MNDHMQDLMQLLERSAEELAPSLRMLETYEELVRKWNPAINIVSKSTLKDLWHRHIIDSAQIFRFCPEKGLWLDLGSGGGFPGVVIAVLAHGIRPDVRVRMIESDLRKTVFLRECCRHLALSAVVLSDRIETLEPQGAAVVSARALAPLSDLCGFVHRHMAPDGTAVFLKGQQADAELAEAGRSWHFELERSESVTNSDASILAIRGLRHA